MLIAARRVVTRVFLGAALDVALLAPLARSYGANQVMAGAKLVPLPHQPDDVPWPTTAWPTASLPAGIATPAFERALAAVDARDAALGETRAIVVIHRGKLVAERYMAGYTAETPLLSWSMAKSVTQALVGIAVRRGLVDIDKPMGNTHWRSDDPRAAIPWRAWLNMVDGQKYSEIGAPDPTRNDAARMLFGEGRLDVAAFAASLPLAHPPGSHWNYNSAGINLIADALGRALVPVGDANMRRARMFALMKGELFDAIGMTSAEPEFDRTGTFIGSAFVYATARDWAKFGYLYLRDGVWDGRRILPEGWVDFARTKTTAGDCDIYGAGFWITASEGAGKPFPSLVQDGPRDLFIAQGHEGQLVVIVPSKDLVVVRLGLFDDRKGFGALGAWVSAIVTAFPDVGSAP
jgi:CubicO group peptidase (beta-lactamase class C family)